MPLTDALCKNARTKPDQRIRKLSEGGLQLCIYPNGSKLWRIAYRYDGKPKTVSLGSYPEFSLADARLKREEIKKSLRSGQDPQSEKQAQKALVAATEPFQAWADRYAARLVLEGRANATLKKQEWLLGMANKTLGNRPISEITAPEVLEVLRKVEAKGRLDTAVRLRATISTVFQDAVAAGTIKADPAAFLGRLIAKPKRKNHPGIVDPAKLQGLLRAIDAYEGQPSTVAALKLAAMLFPRPIELRKAEWPEFDLAKRIWHVPAQRMKMKRDHLVPLPSQAVAILKDLQKVTDSARYVFSSVRNSRISLSENTLNAALRGLGYSKDDHTAHGFRTTASTLLNGSMLWHPDAIERQLAHEDRNAVRKAYDHQTHWARRVAMMQWWADYLESLRLGRPISEPANTNALNQVPIFERSVGL